MEPETPSALAGPSSRQRPAEAAGRSNSSVHPLWCLLRTRTNPGSDALPVGSGSFRVAEAQRPRLLTKVTPVPGSRSSFDRDCDWRAGPGPPRTGSGSTCRCDGRVSPSGLFLCCENKKSLEVMDASSFVSSSCFFFVCLLCFRCFQVAVKCHGNAVT